MTTILIDLLGLAFWQTLFAAAFFFGLIFFIFVIVGSMGDDEADMDDGDLDGDGIPDDAELVDLDGDGVPEGWDVDGDGVPDIDADTDFDIDTELDVDGELMDLDGDGIPDAVDLDGDGIPDMELEGTTDFDFDADGDLIDIDGDGIPDGIDLDGDGIPDVDMDGAPIEFDGEMDPSDFEHVELDNSWDAEPASHKEYRSNYKMGNISVFLFFFGQVGLITGRNLEDQHLLLALLVGLVTMKAFSWFIANYTKTVVVPIQDIKRGDIAVVIYGITPERPGMVQVYRKDGVISTIIARGAFPHDFFEKNERGYVWSKDGEIYTITRGISGQPDLNKNQVKTKKKPLDLQ